MDGKSLRHTLAYVFLGLYVVYGLFDLGMTGLLFSFAIGLIATSFYQGVEIVVAITILSGLAFKIFAKGLFKEGFAPQPVMEPVAKPNMVPAANPDMAPALQLSTQTLPGSSPNWVIAAMYPAKPPVMVTPAKPPAAKAPKAPKAPLAEGFFNMMFGSVPTGTGENLTAISKRVQQLSKRNVFEPSGVLSSNFVESFADMNTAQQPENAGSNTAKPAGENTPSPSTSTPASTNQPTVSKQLEKALPSSNAAAAATPDPKSTDKPPQTQQPQPTVTSGFSDKGTDGMFKLGSIPTEAIGGSHIDIGTTLMNTLNSLKPDQVKAMTEDTKKLMETQKNLMGMLTSMKPMIQDGKQLMETFGQMFGSSQ
jgi:hypothetical protein